jgi:hypothetical protein
MRWWWEAVIEVLLLLEQGGGAAGMHCACTVTNSIPWSCICASSSFVLSIEMIVFWGDGGSIEGRFGWPMMLSSTCAVMSSVSQTMHCPPCKNPLVPSIRSSVHMPVIQYWIYQPVESYQAEKQKARETERMHTCPRFVMFWPSSTPKIPLYYK